MQGTVGWLCPKCGAVISPYEAACTKCAPSRVTYTLGSVTFSGMGVGTVSLGGFSSTGTFYAAPPKTDAQKIFELERQVVTWREQYEALRDGLKELIETDDDDDD